MIYHFACAPSIIYVDSSVDEHIHQNSTGMPEITVDGDELGPNNDFSMASSPGPKNLRYHTVGDIFLLYPHEIPINGNNYM